MFVVSTGAHAALNKLFVPCAFYHISRSASLFKIDFFFHSYKKCRADQYEPNDHKLSLIMTNRSCDIVTHSTNVSCATRLDSPNLAKQQTDWFTHLF
jgi:hypothetical protein